MIYFLLTVPMMGLGGFGGLDLKNIKDMIPEGTFDLIKNMKPADIKNAVANMPPEMVEMLKGMGKSLKIFFFSLK